VRLGQVVEQHGRRREPLAAHVAGVRVGRGADLLDVQLKAGFTRMILLSRDKISVALPKLKIKKKMLAITNLKKSFAGVNILIYYHRKKCVLTQITAVLAHKISLTYIFKKMLFFAEIW
jgi:hypothetical protein